MATSTTWPTPAVLARARTVTSVLVALSSVALTPASVTCTRLLPPPSSRLPLMLTYVPSWPTLGDTVEMTPPSRYVHWPVATVHAPLDATMRTSPVALALVYSLATTTMLLSVADTMRLALTFSRLTDPIDGAPISSPVPVMLTTVPSWPEPGVTPVTCAGAT